MQEALNQNSSPGAQVVVEVQKSRRPASLMIGTSWDIDLDNIMVMQVPSPDNCVEIERSVSELSGGRNWAQKLVMP